MLTLTVKTPKSTTTKTATAKSKGGKTMCGRRGVAEQTS